MGRDNLAMLGGANPQPNPNFGRLTFLYNHGDHFHSIGRFGAVEGRLPEAFIGGRIHLQPGTGDFAGRFVSQAYDDGTLSSEYSNLETRSIHSLAGFPSGSDESVLYNSSGGRWGTLDLDGAVVALELVSITPGLQVGAADGTGMISAPGDRIVLGDGNTFSFLPMFMTDLGAAEGSQFTARFRLVDLRSDGTPFGDSGIFRFELDVPFQPTPVPAGLVVAALGATGLVGVGRVRARRQRS